jgi:hypothetical protein
MSSIIPASISKVIRAMIASAQWAAEARDLLLSFQTETLQRTHPNPINARGQKCFSQADEDGITLEILRRLGCLDSGTFAEFGVGDGTENNTLILKALGWNGFWVGGQNLAFEVRQSPESFCYFKEWITLENIQSLARKGREYIGADALDVVSLDLDGNDLYFVDALLAGGFNPKLFVVEYNAKFPPPVRWTIDYDAGHVWRDDDYFGASLASFDELFQRYAYRLVCCNSATGSIAFFVRKEFLKSFEDVPADISVLYVPPRYVVPTKWGHRRSPKTIAKLFA